MEDTNIRWHQWMWGTNNNERLVDALKYCEMLKTIGTDGAIFENMIATLSHDSFAEFHQSMLKFLKAGRSKKWCLYLWMVTVTSVITTERSAWLILPVNYVRICIYPNKTADSNNWNHLLETQHVSRRGRSYLDWIFAIAQLIQRH